MTSRRMSLGPTVAQQDKAMSRIKKRTPKVSLSDTLRRRILQLEDSNARARARVAWCLTEANVGPYPQVMRVILRETHEILFAAYRGQEV